MFCTCLFPTVVRPRSTAKAPPHSSRIIEMATRMRVAPRSSRTRRHGLRRFTFLPYELGVDICRVLLDEIVEGVTTPMPGSSGKSGLAL